MVVFTIAVQDSEARILQSSIDTYNGSLQTAFTNTLPELLKARPL